MRSEAAARQTRETTQKKSTAPKLLNQQTGWPDSTASDMISGTAVTRLKPGLGDASPTDARHRGPNNPEITEYFRSWCDAEVSAGRSKNGIARDLGVSNSHIVNVMNGKNGVGGDLLRKFAQRVSGGSVDKLQRMSEEYVQRYGFTSRREERHRLADRPGWTEALERAQSMAPHIPATVWQDVGDMSTSKLQLDAAVLIQLATLFLTQSAKGRV